ncbi:glycoside hydrolase family 43 protein [Caulobacter endophyticus]|uniref:glycoside hydrolase family 43 protein n=1 Tax=Caulobacter endophyticus TaxID=2172652 RepID=UPI0024102457|nr:glycoside hydrolase family 43 protein [Caulobacter endophyticus]MDG2527213.1 glycoside hydrolase family 43 protein [Caulobacter endophyticus]
MTSELALRGFNPDPSIVRVGDDYYTATSTFEWFPGVQIFHSRDLKSWRLVARPLNRPDLLDMRGVPDSCGVWAPCLSYADGRFWLVYTVVTRFDGVFKDTHNYVTTCETVDGDWSPRVYLNSSGFDPSLFHDEDGRKWLLNMVWDHRPDRTSFGGVLLQEYDPAAENLVGPIRNIFAGSALGLTEGPHLYRRDGWYHLMVAEGGTGYDHAVTMARSHEIGGPYAVDPRGPMISARLDADAALQRLGHGSLTTAPDGSPVVMHLCSRPIPGLRRSPMGRESALTRCAWSDDGWLRAVGGEARAPKARGERKAYAFLADRPLDPDFQWLRTPDPDEVFSLTERPGFLRLRGREALGGLFSQALVARRQTEFVYVAETSLAFEPDSFQQMAGLVAYYNGHKHHYLYVSWDEVAGKHLGLMSCAGDLSLTNTFPLEGARVPLPRHQPVRLKVEVDHERLVFSWALEDGPWHRIGPELDTSVLSDEAGKGEGANFTGAFVGMCAQDLTGRRAPADFAGFDYQTFDET